MTLTHNKQSQCTSVIFDLDNTITRFDTYVRFLLYILSRRPQRAMLSLGLPCAIILYKLGFRDNTWLKKVFLGTIAGGARRSQIDEWSNQFIANILENGVYPRALMAIEEHKRQGHKLLLASASFDFYVIKLGCHLGFDDVICTRSSWNTKNTLAKDTLNGNISGNNCYGPDKLSRVKEYFGDSRDQWRIIAYTDHHSDQPMLEWVDQAIVVNPTAKLRKLSGHRDYEIQNW